MDYIRWYGDVHEMPAGSYRRTIRTDGTHGATICCHACGQRYALAAGHHIDPTGHVTPSVVCPHEGCSQHGGEHVAIRLRTSLTRAP